MKAIERCGHSGGTGIGAGHVCICVRGKGHDLTDSPRPHGCSCMALWRDSEEGYTPAAESTAEAALEPGVAALFSPAALARVVSVTGLSLQTVTEVARELKRGGGD